MSNIEEIMSVFVPIVGGWENFYYHMGTDSVSKEACPGFFEITVRDLDEPEVLPWVQRRFATVDCGNIETIEDDDYVGTYYKGRGYDEVDHEDLMKLGQGLRRDLETSRIVKTKEAIYSEEDWIRDHPEEKTQRPDISVRRARSIAEYKSRLLNKKFGN